jgi:hypothetical protein
MFYAMVFLMAGSSGKPIDWGETVPEANDFRWRVWAGEVNLRDNHRKIIYGRVHYVQLLEKMRQARYGEAVKIITDRHATS